MANTTEKRPAWKNGPLLWGVGLIAYGVLATAAARPLGMFLPLWSLALLVGLPLLGIGLYRWWLAARA